MTVALENIATAGMTVAAAAVTFVAFRAWLHRRSEKILLLAVAFSLFFVKGLILSVALFLATDWGSSLLPVSVVLDLVILGLFYVAILTRAAS